MFHEARGHVRRCGLGPDPCNEMSAICAIPIIGTIFCPSGTLPAGVPPKMCLDPARVFGGIIT